MKTRLWHLVIIGILASACESNGPGTGAAGHSGTGTGGNGTVGKVIDCGVHSSMGSCGPISDDCYCPGTRCENPGVGSYFCVFPCVSDSDCVFDIIYAGQTVPWEGTCSGGSAGRKFCVAKMPSGNGGGTGGPGTGTGGSGPGSGGSGPGAGGAVGGPGSGAAGSGSGAAGRG